MSDHTIIRLEDVDDVFGGKYPGAMRQFTGDTAAPQTDEVDPRRGT